MYLSCYDFWLQSFPDFVVLFNSSLRFPMIIYAAEITIKYNIIGYITVDRSTKH